MKRNATGIAGIGLAILVAILLVSVKANTYARTFIQVDAALVVVMLGLVAAVRGSLQWLILSAVGIAEVALIIFR
ncbi:MAG TPA: hypothetical protein VFE01_04595 [Terracidiphilus sp.]|jgi:hypothetical protein|nr:hypothetical protein [Terracidiphilus sp.]